MSVAVGMKEHSVSQRWVREQISKAAQKSSSMPLFNLIADWPLYCTHLWNTRLNSDQARAIFSILQSNTVLGLKRKKGKSICPHLPDHASGYKWSYPLCSSSNITWRYNPDRWTKNIGFYCIVIAMKTVCRKVAHGHTCQRITRSFSIKLLIFVTLSL